MRVLLVAVLMTNRRVRISFIYILYVTGAVFLFFGGPDYYAPRSFRLAWDLGHICLFFVWTYALMKTWKDFARKPVRMQLILIVLITLCVGFVIEWVQSGSHRTFSIADVFRNIVGSTAAIVLLSPAGLTLSKRLLRSLHTIVGLVVLLLTYPLVRALTDEAIARKQFPVLSNFDTPFEIHRWQSRSTIAIDRETVKEGNASLRVRLNTDKYSGASLVYFPPDWRNYKYFHMSIFNASEKPLKVTLRMHDDQHIMNGFPYTDRFNREFVLAHGWNDIHVAIEEIRNAPTNRAMDLGAVKDVTVFTVSLKAPKVIYIDDVRLAPLNPSE